VDGGPGRELRAEADEARTYAQLTALSATAHSPAPRTDLPGACPT